MKYRGVALRGLGWHAPARIVPNAELESGLGLEPGWIERRTGIRTRRWAAPGDTLAALARVAAEQALAGVDRGTIGLVLLATSTPDQRLPPTAPHLAHLLGLPRAGATDLAGACTGFVNALVLADGFVRRHGKAVLVVGANILSRRIDRADRASAVLFGDAAGAMLLAPGDDPGQGILGADLASDGGGYGLVQVPADADTMTITDGRALFAQAVRLMTECAGNALADAGLAIGDVTRFLPHQANARIMERVCHNLGLGPAIMLSSIAAFGNSSAATIPLTLAQNPPQAGDRVLITAAGAGLIGGAVVLGA